MDKKQKIVETLLMDIQENDLSFNWYIVIDYHYANNTINKVEDDNWRLRYVLRKSLDLILDSGSSMKCIDIHT